MIPAGTWFRFVRDIGVLQSIDGIVIYREGDLFVAVAPIESVRSARLRHIKSGTIGFWLINTDWFEQLPEPPSKLERILG